MNIYDIAIVPFTAYFSYEIYVSIQIQRQYKRNIQRLKGFSYAINNCTTWQSMYDLMQQHKKDNPKMYENIDIPYTILWARHRKELLACSSRQE